MDKRIKCYYHWCFLSILSESSNKVIVFYNITKRSLYFLIKKEGFLNGTVV